MLINFVFNFFFFFFFFFFICYNDLRHMKILSFMELSGVQNKKILIDKLNLRFYLLFIFQIMDKISALEI